MNDSVINAADDIEKAMVTVEKIKPIIDGLTLKQIELCFEYTLQNIRNGVPVKFPE